MSVCQMKTKIGKYAAGAILCPSLWLALVFGLATILYSFGWSNLNTQLNYTLVVVLALMFLTAILVCALEVKHGREIERLPESSRPHYHKVWMTLILVLFLAEFVYNGGVPFLRILDGTQTYMEFSGIPQVHVILITGSSYYAIRLSYIFITKQDRGLLPSIACIYLLFMLENMRSQVLVCIFATSILYGTSFLTKKNRSIKQVSRITFLCVAAIIAVLFIFGAYGNARSGQSWTDSTYIESLGLYNSNYPEWLPKQFMWAYSYITSPLANLNYNFDTYIPENNIVELMGSLMPDFISKRVFDIPTPAQVVPYFTVCTGLADSYCAFGVPGLVVFLGVIQIYAFAFEKMCTNSIDKMLVRAIVCMLFAFMFFDNTVRYSGFSLIALYPIVHSLYCRLRVRMKLKTSLGDT